MTMTGVSGLRSLFRPGNASVALSVVVVIWLAQLMWPQADMPQQSEKHEAQAQPKQEQAAPEKIAPEQATPAVPTSVRLPAPPPLVLSEQNVATEQVAIPAAETSAPIEPEPAPAELTPIEPAPEKSVEVEVPAPLQPRKIDKADPATAYPPLKPTVTPERVEPSPPIPPEPQILQASATPSRPAVSRRAPAQAAAIQRVSVEQAAAASDVVRVSAADVKSGRTWLRILEHGQGPAIEIAWPTGTKGARLFSTMARCYGLTIAMHSNDGRLYADVGRQGEAWDLNLDRYSGFMRQVGSWHAPAERQAIQKIHARHRGLRGTPVRLFPRRVDARLLAGLGQMIGEGYADAGSIRASYVLRDGRLFVENVSVDGVALSGKVDLSPSAKCTSGGGI